MVIDPTEKEKEMDTISLPHPLININLLYRSIYHHLINHNLFCSKLNEIIKHFLINLFHHRLFLIKYFLMIEMMLNRSIVQQQTQSKKHILSFSLGNKTMIIRRSVSVLATYNTIKLVLFIVRILTNEE